MVNFVEFLVFDVLISVGHHFTLESHRHFQAIFYIKLHQVGLSPSKECVEILL